MKFVHLTDRRNIGRILKDGIRLGNGVFGKGVYAVPLARMSFQSVNWHDGPCTEQIWEVPRASTIRMWKWLWRPWRSESSKRATEPAAIIFTLPETHWPVDFWFLLEFHNCNSFITAAQKVPSPRFSVDLAAIRAALAKGGSSHFRMVARDPAGLGQALQVYRCSGERPEFYYESLEVVIPGAIPRRCISSVIPLYESTKRFHSRRGKSRRHHDLQ